MWRAAGALRNEGTLVVSARQSADSQNIQNTATMAADKERGAHSGRLNSPILDFAYWLRAVHIALRRSWHGSMFRLVAGEIYRFPFRISANLKNQDLRFGPAIPSDPRQHGQMSLREESRYLFACSNDIKELSAKHPWMGPLDQELAAKAHQLGAIALLGILDSCKQSGDKG